MRFSVLGALVSLLCIVVLAGCAATPQPPRSIITFDYTPANEDDTGSAGVTFAVLETQLLTSNQLNVTQLVFQTPSPLIADFANNMTKDFMELLSSRGYGVRGPFKSYDDMIHPEKEGSDLLLAAEVDIDLDVSGVRHYYKDRTFGVDGYAFAGPVKVRANVNLIVYESLTNTKMWKKNIAIPPQTVRLKSHNLYTAGYLAQLGLGSVSHPDVRGSILFYEWLKSENKFYSGVGRVLESQYADILNRIFDYLDPREMSMVKSQSMELRKKKVY